MCVCCRWCCSWNDQLIPCQPRMGGGEEFEQGDALTAVCWRKCLLHCFWSFADVQCCAGGFAVIFSLFLFTFWQMYEFTSVIKVVVECFLPFVLLFKRLSVQKRRSAEVDVTAEQTDGDDDLPDWSGQTGTWRCEQTVTQGRSQRPDTDIHRARPTICFQTAPKIPVEQVGSWCSRPRQTDGSLEPS